MDVVEEDPEREGHELVHRIKRRVSQRSSFDDLDSEQLRALTLTSKQLRDMSPPEVQRLKDKHVDRWDERRNNAMLEFSSEHRGERTTTVAQLEADDLFEESEALFEEERSKNYQTGVKNISYNMMSVVADREITLANKIAIMNYLENMNIRREQAIANPTKHVKEMSAKRKAVFSKLIAIFTSGLREQSSFCIRPASTQHKPDESKAYQVKVWTNQYIQFLPKIVVKDRTEEYVVDMCKGLTKDVVDLPKDNLRVLPKDSAVVSHVDSAGVSHKDSVGVSHKDSAGVSHVDNAKGLTKDAADSPKDNFRILPRDNSSAGVSPMDNAKGLTKDVVDLPKDSARVKDTMVVILPRENNEGKTSDNAVLPKDDAEVWSKDDAATGNDKVSIMRNDMANKDNMRKKVCYEDHDDLIMSDKDTMHVVSRDRIVAKDGQDNLPQVGVKKRLSPTHKFNLTTPSEKCTLDGSNIGLVGNQISSTIPSNIPMWHVKLENRHNLKNLVTTPRILEMDLRPGTILPKRKGGLIRIPFKLSCTLSYTITSDNNVEHIGRVLPRIMDHPYTTYNWHAQYDSQ